MTTITIQTELVKEVCIHAIDYITTHREDLRNKRISELMNKRFFRCKSVEEALGYMNKYDEWPDYKYEYYGDLKIAEELLKLIKLSESEWITLGREDALFVARYMK